jgi:arginine decarboxylase
MEVLGVTSYGDLSSFAQQQQSRASAFILSIDDEELGPVPRGGGRCIAEPARLRQEIRFQECRDPDLSARRNAHLAPHPERHPA